MPAAEDSLSPALDSVLRKYGKIWIWSILSAAITAFSLRSMTSVLQAVQFVSITPNPNMRGAFIFPGGGLILLITLLPSVASLFSVYYLFQFLRYHLLPILFPHPPAEAGFTLTGAPAAGKPLAEQEDVTAPDGASLLYRAFVAVVIGVALEVAIPIVGVVIRMSL